MCLYCILSVFAHLFQVVSGAYPLCFLTESPNDFKTLAACIFSMRVTQFKICIFKLLKRIYVAIIKRRKLIVDGFQT